MKDIVLIPTYLRPEYLYLCLEKLSQARRPSADLQIWILADSRPHDSERFKIVLDWQKQVFAEWRGRLPLFWPDPREHEFSGNSFNVMRGYEAAFASTARNIYLVEDDVLVTPDFFTWHEAMAELEPDAMCSIAYRCSRNDRAHKNISDPGAYFSTACDYASIGVRWSREKLAPLMEHINRDYFSAQDQYMLKRFPGNRFAGDFAEQDGLIMRIMWETRAFTVWPYVPRCYHMGWYGYHRPNGKRPNGFLEQKIGAIRGIINDADALRTAAPDFGDIEPYNSVQNVPVTKYTKLQNFE